MGRIVCISLVHDCLRLFSFVHCLLSYLSQGWGAGTCDPPFLILDSKMGSIVCILFVHDCIRLVFFRLYTSYFSTSPREVGDMLSPFSDFGFENGLNRLYFVSTWLYTSFFVCTHLTFFLPLPEGAGDMLSPPFLNLDSKMVSIVCISLVHDCICLFSFVLLLFYLTLGRGGWAHAIRLFLILDLKMGSIICITLVHDCLPLFLSVHLLLFFSTSS